MGRYLEALRKPALPLGDTPPKLPQPPPGGSCVGLGGASLGESVENHGANLAPELLSNVEIAGSFPAPDHTESSPAKPTNTNMPGRYSVALNRPEVLDAPGLPPPSSVAPYDTWCAEGLHGAAWAAWWAAVERQRAHKATTGTPNPKVLPSGSRAKGSSIDRPARFMARKCATLLDAMQAERQGNGYLRQWKDLAATAAPGCAAWKEEYGGAAELRTLERVAPSTATRLSPMAS